MLSGRSAITLLLCASFSPHLVSAQSGDRESPAGALPLKLAPRATSPAITPADLMTRLYIFADDSMMGREVGTVYNLKGTAYIEHEVRRLGLRPAGDSGGYFQNLPLVAYSVDSASELKIGTTRLKLGTDFLPVPAAERRTTLDGLRVVYGGSSADSNTWIAADAAAGSVVVLRIPPSARPYRKALVSSSGRFGRAAAVLFASYDRVTAVQIPFIMRRLELEPDDTSSAGPISMFVTPRVAALMLGDSLTGMRTGTTGRAISGDIVTHQIRAPGRNVIAVLLGADARLKGEYVALGAHNDHIGFNHQPVDHDSVRAFNIVVRPEGEDSPVPETLTTHQVARIRTMTDSLHRLHGSRRDSIYNGADDDGSGTVTLLEIAEAFATAPTRPSRSILFVWHTGEEAGLYGSRYFTDHPTIPRDSIVAQLNMDMVGRGAASDVTGETKDGTPLHGGKGYLQLVGSRRLSTELGNLIERVNKERHLGFNFDYAEDANGHPDNFYCRSDHYEYARYGIPIVFFSTGGNADYHQVTDEPQYIDYSRMAHVATLVYDAALAVANLDHRVVVDKPKPDPKGACAQ